MCRVVLKTLIKVIKLLKIKKYSNYTKITIIDNIKLVAFVLQPSLLVVLLSTVIKEHNLTFCHFF